MTAGSGIEWIPTERTHWLAYVQVFGSIPIVAAALVLLWFDVLIPELGLWPGILTVLVASIVCGLADLLAWQMFRPSAVRVSPDGISIRRLFGRPRDYPTGGFRLSTRSPSGFGIITGPGIPFVVLSPNQFAAARQVFPVTEPTARAAPTPPS